MRLWRVSRHRSLAGAGGRIAPGRWHHAGHPVVYLAETPAAALLETCVHTSANDVPPEFTLLEIRGPDLDVPSIEPAGLPAGWRRRPELTRDLGTAWLEKKDSVLLRVPSAIVPETMNCLLNPLHRQASGFRVVRALRHPFDLRIKL